jgi:hypothetical protein
MTMAMAMAARAMAMATRVLGEQQQGRWRRRQLWRVTMRGIAAAMRVASDKEGEGGKAMEMVTRVAGEQW